MRRAFGVALASVLFVLVEHSTSHAAGRADQCFDAYEKAQRLRKDGHLRASREQLAICAPKHCPAFVSKDCTKWSAEVDRLLPTAVFAAGDGHGHDVTDVRVFVDDVKMADSLDGRAIPVDPGSHVVRFEWQGRTLTSKVLFPEGEIRNVRADFADPASSPPAPAPASDNTAARSGGKSIPTLSWVLGGVAVAGGISAIAFYSAGKSAQNCMPTCNPSQVSAVKRDFALADVSWIVGLAAGVGAVYFVLSAPATSSTSTAQSSTSLRLGVAPGGLVASGTF